MLRSFVRGRNPGRERERERKRESVFCVLLSFLVFEGFRASLKTWTSLSDKFSSCPSARRVLRAKPCNRCEPTRVVQNRIQNVVFREKPPATRPSRLRARGTGVAIRAHTFRLVYKKEGGETKKKGLLKERTASVTTAVLFWGVGIARVDDDTTLESPRAPRKIRRTVKDWNNADIFYSPRRSSVVVACTCARLFFCVDKSMINGTSQKEKSEKGKKNQK